MPADNIEYNITTVASHTQAASRELVQAHEYQRKAGRRAFCLLIIVGVVISVVLLAVRLAGALECEMTS